MKEKIIRQSPEVTFEIRRQDYPAAFEVYQFIDRIENKVRAETRDEFVRRLDTAVRRHSVSLVWGAMAGELEMILARLKENGKISGSSVISVLEIDGSKIVATIRRPAIIYPPKRQRASLA